MRLGSCHLRARLLVLAVIAAGLFVGCAPPTTQARPPATPTPSSQSSCQGDDHAIADAQLGWGFCYPATWRYRERSAQVGPPQGIDTTFDIVEFAPNTPDDGKFGFMIVSTYQRQGAAHLADWVQQYAPDQTGLHPLSWGNAQEAVQADSGRRLALTPHHVVELDIREGVGNLGVEEIMSSRLATWRFDY